MDRRYSNMQDRIRITPYKGGTPYAKMRENAGNRHEYGLCASVRSDFMKPGEQFVIRTSEIVGYEDGYFYDDHIPTYDIEGRGKNYTHIPRSWLEDKLPEKLYAVCKCGQGVFSLELAAGRDHMDIELSVRNDSDIEMRHVDWNFCAVGYDSTEFGDNAYDRTYVSINGGLVTLKSLFGPSPLKAVNVSGGDNYFAFMYKDYGFCSEKSDKSLVIVESANGRYSAGLGFEQSNFIFCGPWNKCFHADPWFGGIPAGGMRTVAGKLYVIEGRASDILARYRKDFNK